MLIYVDKELSNSFNASDRKYFKSKVKDYKLFFSKSNMITKKFLSSSIVFGNIPPKMIESSSKLEWVQLESTGFSEYKYLEKLNFSLYRLRFTFSGPN